MKTHTKTHENVSLRKRSPKWNFQKRNKPNAVYPVTQAWLKCNNRFRIVKDSLQKQCSLVSMRGTPAKLERLWLKVDKFSETPLKTTLLYLVKVHVSGQRSVMSGQLYHKYYITLPGLETDHVRSIA